MGTAHRSGVRHPRPWRRAP